MKFISIGDFHYNLDHIVCFWWSSGFVCIQSMIDINDVSRHSDPERAYYESLCRATGVIPCEEVKE